MKISKIFHWLYFTVMMLPCVIIPIFAIYTRNENYNSNIEVQIEQNQRIDFNQIYENGNIDTLDGYTALNGTLELQDNIITLTPTSLQNQFRTRIEYRYIYPTINHKYLFRFNILCNKACYGGVYANGIGGTNNYTQFEGNVWQTLEFISTATTNNQQVLYFGNEWEMNTNNYLKITKLNVFDLTQMFGVGNEPSVETFNSYFDSPYYSYTESEISFIPTTPITYNDTDVGSQFVYTLYNVTDKYFNFDNFFGLDNVYSWIQLNWFSGNAPLGFAIFWHFFTYWLLASLAWLLFDLMVYVPLFIHRWLDKGAIE